MDRCIVFLSEHPLSLPLYAALAIAGVATARLVWTEHANLRPWSSMNLPNWDFSRSWASNVTVAAAVLAVVMSTIVGPLQASQEKTGYVGLNLAFLALATLAPCLFNAIRHAVPKGSDVGYFGYAGVFIVAAVITAWAAYGQLAVFALATAQAFPAGSSLESVRDFLLDLIAAIAIALVPYLLQTIYWTVRTQTQGSVAARATTPPPRWAML